MCSLDAKIANNEIKKLCMYNLFSVDIYILLYSQKKFKMYIFVPMS